MWVEIICGVVIYKLLWRFFLNDSDKFPRLDSGDSRLCFLVADRFEKVYGGKAYVGLRIPDADSGSRQSIDAVLVTEREMIVIAVRNFGGYVEVGKDRTWICRGTDKVKGSTCRSGLCAETVRQTEILKSYLERRGVTLPQEHFRARVVLPNPYCRVSPSIYSVPEVITHDKWSDLKPEGRSGFPLWIKHAFRGGKGDSPDGIYQKLQFILSTAPMWDRLELMGDKVILGEFLEFKGKQEDLQSLQNLKRSKVSQFVVQKSLRTSASERKEITVKESTEVIFQPLQSRKVVRCKLSKIVSLSLSA
ncbi:unnamed protein product [Spirodela intermedia]|uniref:NERD domain-containing protein n=1 Tax=Spirodela intermedia TaxID=51605 RepID=A0A7I8JUC3_SPIIN|nr:unnamed protein product [Spirodela intermedia]CAA6673786.1 unnamed protein product [Spirodela intermedia]